VFLVEVPDSHACVFDALGIIGVENARPRKWLQSRSAHCRNLVVVELQNKCVN